ncbi:MAG: NUDIX hydrolase [Pseudomonadota bacterium]|nr:NUDIX hydrolase [Pseudomonadota bacterium]
MAPTQYWAPPPTRPARPRHAASLVLLRSNKQELEALLGRRPMTARFMPGVYVFPGGALEREDYAVASALELRPDVETRLSRHGGKRRARALAWAAIRETWEETGIMVGKQGTFEPTNNIPATRAFKDAGLIPSVAKLDYIVRAVTPTHSPIRFDTRFFTAEGKDVRGELVETNELEDIGWYSLRHVLSHLKIMGVTRFVLEEAQRNRLNKMNEI